ncbi:hypothetical protein, partial [Actinomyces sp. 186855]|uniref:hypothetical protein n=1 Tax=Actinomyces sp. 186855 TaxID=2761164 RepID=UPI00203047C5
MNRRIVSAVAAVLGLVVIVLAVCSATVWRPSATATASLAQEPDQPYALVEPGVLGLVGSDVTVTATAEGQNVLIAVAYSADARAWLTDDPYVSVTGLSDWTVLSSQSVTERCTADATPSAATAPATQATASAAPQDSASAQATADATGTAAATAIASPTAAGCTPLTASGANPAGSVLWQSTVTGRGSATLDLDATDSDLVVLVATDGSSAAPTLTLSWLRPVATPFFIPGLVLGALLILAGVGGLLFDLQMRRADEERRRRAAERAARLAAADSVQTVTIPRVGDPDRPLTRREKRDKERAEAAGEEWVDPRTGAVYLDGVAAPPVPPADTAGQDAGAPRGSAVLPGLDAQATAAHRSARALEGDTAFAVTDEDASQDTAEPAGPLTDR